MIGALTDPDRQGRRSVVVVAALLVAPLLWAGCGLLDTRSEAGVVGDSITLQVVDEVRRQATDEWRLDIRPMPGATVGEMLPAVAAVADAGPEQVIINLGTNNVLRSVPIEQTTADLEVMFDLLASVPCVHVVTVHEYIFSWDEGYLTYRSQPVNEALVATAQARGAQVVDWTAVLTEARVPLDAPEYLTDTVHLTEDGITLLAQTYHDALTSGCP
jgi:hypothetical protein